LRVFSTVVLRRAAIHPDCPRNVRGHRISVGHHRHLQCDGIHSLSPSAGNRHPHGPRCSTEGHSAHGTKKGSGFSHRRRTRRGGYKPGYGAFHRRPYLGCLGERPMDLFRRRCRHRLGWPSSLLATSSQSHRSGPAARPPFRVTQSALSLLSRSFAPTPTRKPFNSQSLISHLTNSNGCGILSIRFC